MHPKSGKKIRTSLMAMTFCLSESISERDHSHSAAPFILVKMGPIMGFHDKEICRISVRLSDKSEVT